MDGSVNPLTFMDGSVNPLTFVDGSVNPLTFMDGSVNPLTFMDGSVNPIMYINTNQLSEDYCQLTHRGGYIMCDAYFRIESTKNENVNNII